VFGRRDLKSATALTQVSPSGSVTAAWSCPSIRPALSRHRGASRRGTGRGAKPCDAGSTMRFVPVAKVVKCGARVIPVWSAAARLRVLHNVCLRSRSHRSDGVLGDDGGLWPRLSVPPRQFVAWAQAG
jgi:hypothetical protein